MVEHEITRLDELIALAPTRAGGAYPAVSFAQRAPSKTALAARIASSPLAAIWNAWSDVAARTHALAQYEPAHAAVHCALADLVLRADDAHNEPHPELTRGAVAGYGAVLAQLQSDFDNDSEMYATRRGLGYAVGLAQPLFTGDARTCLARGLLALGNWPYLAPPDRAELAEFYWLEKRGIDVELLPLLPAPALVTELGVGGKDFASAIDVLARMPHLRRLSGRTQVELDDTATTTMSRLPLVELGLGLHEDHVHWPRWIAQVPSLRSVSVSYSNARGTSGAEVDIPATIGDCTQLESLTLKNVRSLPRELEQLVALTTLEIEGWPVTAVPEAVTRMPRLFRLKVDPTLALGDLPAGFENMRSLRWLRLGHLVTPAIPRALFAMPWLEHLTLIHEVAWSADDVAALQRALPTTKITFAPSGALARSQLRR